MRYDPDQLAQKLAGLSSDELVLYHQIAGTFLAAISPDYLYDQTEIQIELAGLCFKATGRAEIEAGWKAVFKDQKQTDKPDKQALPAINDDAPLYVSGAEVVSRTTTPSPRFSEAQMPDVLENAWKVCPG